jgi:UDP-N-acetylglucosamine diphosphorylase / glucose-1-phosphate thymidylyltransferase / UDP-N-acetylgalactosamine diphosphorylase / glucosamine-1-phosphate N-acetyltransferase / galactosamine-1-phosphate N-acetyltransferase
MRDRPAGPAESPPRTTGLVGLIPAAGRGVRAYPYTQTIPKSMLEVDGVPLIRRNVELLRDRLGIDEIRIVIGHQGHVIRDYLGDGSDLGVRITYIENDRLDLELIWSIHLGSRGVDRPCAIVLADECYVDTNHDALAALDDGAAVRCGLIDGEYAKQIRKNYIATLDGDRIVDLHEKPAVVTERLMGTGTWIVQPEIFRRLEAALESDPAERPRDWVGWLGQLCREGVDVRAFRLSGRYVNVNSRDDLNYANFLVRERTFDQKTTSLVYVVDDQEDAAARPITGFADREELTEVVAIARRTAPALEAAARHPKVRLVIVDPATKIGMLFLRGMDEARGDLILLSYSDDTFSPRDVSKMLVYLRDADLVVGTRTTRQMIEQGANMQGVVRAAHLFLAKLLELLWWRFECRFTDVCCVYRGIWRSTWTTIRGNLTATGVEIVPEMVIEVLRARRRIVEIPVNYYNRDLEFGYVRSRYQSFGTFVRIVGLMLRKRLERTA